jgi:hypothetical protein
MIKQKIALLIPISIVAILIIYTWVYNLTNGLFGLWKHYLTLVLFLPIVYLFFNNYKGAIIATGLYLLLGTFGLLALTPRLTTTSYFVKIVSVEIGTPQIQWWIFGLLILFLILNFEPLVNLYLDFKEKKESKSKS